MWLRGSLWGSLDLLRSATMSQQEGFLPNESFSRTTNECRRQRHKVLDPYVSSYLRMRWGQTLGTRAFLLSSRGEGVYASSSEGTPLFSGFLRRSIGDIQCRKCGYHQLSSELRW